MTDNTQDQPRPQRRRIRKRWFLAVALVLVAVPVVMLTIQVVRISIATPGVVGDYPQKLRDLIQTQQPPQPQGRDGFVIIAEAKRKLDELRAPIQDRVEQTRNTTFDNEFKRIRIGPEFLHDTAIDPNNYLEDDPGWELIEPFNDLIRSATWEMLRLYESSEIRTLLDTIGPSTPSVIPVQDRILIDTLLPSLGPARELARWEAACMGEDAAQGEWADYHIAARRLLALSDATARTPILICGLVGYAIEDVLYKRLLADISSRQLPLQTLDAIDVMLREHAGPTPLSVYFDGERIFILDMVDRTHSDNGEGDGFFLPASLAVPSGTNAGPSIANVPGLLAPSKAETVATVDRLYASWIDRAQTPPHQRSGDPPITDVSFWNPLIDLAAPAVFNAITPHDKVVCERAAVRVVVAIERYRIANTRLPESLADLVPEFMRELPHDPFAEDGRLRYRTDEHSSRGYTLYSVGRDMQDDGGQWGDSLWSDDPDAVFIPWTDD